jgi:hypothetical protein
MGPPKSLEFGAIEKGKIFWSGKVISVQPRIRLLRSFDQRSHSYLGYVLQVQAMIESEERTLVIGIGKGAQKKHQFQAGDLASGKSEVVPDARTEVAEYYKTSELRLLKKIEESEVSPPPWQGPAPDLEIYRQRGHRRLDARTYEGKCVTCIWGCRMPMEMIIDHWNPSKKKYRFETFCYGPKSCSLYKAGLTRKVPGRKGMVWEEEDWVDEEAVSHRGVDE